MTPTEQTHSPHLLTDPLAARAYVLAGAAVFTLRSRRTGTRYTYRIRAPRDDDGRVVRDGHMFASVLCGPDNGADYAYAGVVRDGEFRVTAKSRVTCDDPRAKALGWTLGKLAAGELPAELEIWHEGRCGRCARRLTDPESIVRGLGPECAGRGA